VPLGTDKYGPTSDSSLEVKSKRLARWERGQPIFRWNQYTVRRWNQRSEKIHGTAKNLKLMEKKLECVSGYMSTHLSLTHLLGLYH
jgi:hypothetical protein